VRQISESGFSCGEFILRVLMTVITGGLRVRQELEITLVSLRQLTYAWYTGSLILIVIVLSVTIVLLYYALRYIFSMLLSMYNWLRRFSIIQERGSSFSTIVFVCIRLPQSGHLWLSDLNLPSDQFDMLCHLLIVIVEGLHDRLALVLVLDLQDLVLLCALH